MWLSKLIHLTGRRYTDPTHFKSLFAECFLQFWFSFFACSPAFDSQFSISVTHSHSPIADQLPYSNSFSSPSTSCLKLRVKFYFVFHLIGEECLVMIKNVWSAMTYTARNTTRRNIFWIHCFAVFLIRSILWFLLPQHGRFSMALFRAVKHRRVSDTYFPKHILVILRHACLGVIWQSQVALVQVSHFPSQAQTSQCIYNK